MTKTPHFGMRLPPCDRADRVADVVVESERAGFDMAWLPDSQLLWRDVFVSIALAAVQTRHIRLATAVSNFATRHASVVASSINTLEELAPHRIILGFGTGDSSVRLIGERPSRQEELTRAMEMVRSLLSGESFDFGKRTSRLKDAQGQVPLYMAASGPNNLRYAGEHADGVVVLAGISPDALHNSLGYVRDGAIRAGRSIEDLDVVVGTFCHITDNIAQDAKMLKPVCAAIAQIGGQEFLKIAGIELEDPGYIEGVYPDLSHAEDWDLATQKSAEFVTDEMAIRFAETFCLFGTPDVISERIDQAVDVGANGFYIRHVGNYELPVDLMRAFAREVLPRYREKA